MKDPNPILFDEPALKNAITCAIMMSFVDGEIHEKEWDVIQSFIDQFWQEDFSDQYAFKAKVSRDIEMIFSKSESFQAKTIEMVETLAKDLNSAQKDIVLNLVGDVMAADGIMTLEESKLFATFMDKLGIRFG